MLQQQGFLSRYLSGSLPYMYIILSLSPSLSLYIYPSIYIYIHNIYTHIYSHTQTHIHTHIHTYIHTYIHVSVAKWLAWLTSNCGRIGAIGSSPSNGLKPNL